MSVVKSQSFGDPNPNPQNVFDDVQELGGADNIAKIFQINLYNDDRGVVTGIETIYILRDGNIKSLFHGEKTPFDYEYLAGVVDQPLTFVGVQGIKTVIVIPEPPTELTTVGFFLFDYHSGQLSATPPSAQFQFTGSIPGAGQKPYGDLGTSLVGFGGTVKDDGKLQSIYIYKYE